MLRLSSQSVVYQRIVKDVKMALFAPNVFLFSNNGSFSRVFVKNILNLFRANFSTQIGSWEHGHGGLRRQPPVLLMLLRCLAHATACILHVTALYFACYCLYFACNCLSCACYRLGGWPFWRAGLRAQRATLPGRRWRYLGRRSWSFYACGGMCRPWRGGGVHAIRAVFGRPLQGRFPLALLSPGHSASQR